ncbi:MAG: TonB-dependent receptor [Daejeonella sp.]
MKRKITFYALLLGLTFTHLPGWSQTRPITGTVTDPAGELLPGVSVRSKAGRSGISTDINGQFRLAAIPNDTLIFSYLGFVTREIPLNGRTSVDVTLTASASFLSEVVVIGYGTQKKVNLTGAVSSIDFKDVQNVPQANTLNLLQGRLPGVSLVQPGGQPGDDQADVNIRGIGTLNDASPLVIIDGAQATLNDLGTLSPAEIANISVLKDAASSAIYGARGANGVILVTTKEPGKEKISMNFNAYTGIQAATYLPKYVESWQWMTLHNEATGTALYSTSDIEQLKAGKYTDSLANTKWPQELFKPAPMSSYTLNLNGGSQALAYQASLGYITQDGIMNNTRSERYNFRTNVKAEISKKLNAGLNLYGNMKGSKQPFDGSVSASSTTTSQNGSLIAGGNNNTVNSIMNAMNQAYPYVPVKTSNGEWGVYGYANGGVINNPVLLTQIGQEDFESLKANAQTFLEYKPVNGLKLRTTLNYQYGNDYKERFNPTYSYPNLQGLPAFVNQQSQVQNLEAQDKQLQWQTTAIYNKTFAKRHAFTFLGGHEYIGFKNRQFTATGYDIPNNNLQVLGSAVSNFSVGGIKQGWSLQSFFGRVNYVLADKYLFEANVRADGSSRFPDGNKYGIFPSLSAGWILSQEKFFEKLTNTVSLFKIRASWGQTGNDRIGNYPFTQFINLNNFYGIGGALRAAASYTTFANPGLKWETTTSSNLGLDVGLFKGAIQANFDVFNRITDDILFKLPLPASYGTIDPAIQNIGSVSNKGWELGLDYRSKLGAQVFYRLGVNVSYVKNNIEKLNNQESIYGPASRYILREGEAINSYYGYEYVGLYRTAEDVAKYPAFSTSGFKLGTTILKDQNNDGKIDANDRVVLGNANTPYTFGLNGGTSYKGFDMNFLFQGVQGKKVYIYDSGNRPGNAGNTNFWAEWWDKRYDPVLNPEGEWPVLKRTAPEIGQVTNGFFLNDASYIRLKNIELGYTFPSKITSKFKAKSFRVYLSGQNLLTFSKLIKQIDPERPALVQSNNTYPQTKLTTAGINMNF